jgi:uncharacterized membrane protein required for colicin V production
MDSWNGLDFLIFLIFALNTIIGMQRGASREIIAMMCLSAALIFTIKFTVPLAAFFNSSPLINNVVDNYFTQNFMLAIGAGPLTADMLMEAMYCISMLICFVGIYSICAASLNVAGVNEYFSFPYATLSRKVGAALGATRGYIITVIFLSILMLHLLKNNAGGEIISGSYFAGLFRTSVVRFDELVTARKPEDYTQIFKEKDLYNATDVMKQLKGTLEPSNGTLQPQGGMQPTGNQPAAPAPKDVPAAPAATPSNPADQ